MWCVGVCGFISVCVGVCVYCALAKSWQTPLQFVDRAGSCTRPVFNWQKHNQKFAPPSLYRESPSHSLFHTPLEFNLIQCLSTLLQPSEAICLATPAQLKSQWKTTHCLPFVLSGHRQEQCQCTGASHSVQYRYGKGSGEGSVCG